MAVHIPAVYPTSRRIGKLIKPNVERYSLKVGGVVWATNQLQGQFFRIFAALACPNNSNIAHAIWHSITSDKTQREMMVEVAKIALKERKRLLSAVVWLSKSAGQIATYRNDAIHTPTTVDLQKWERVRDGKTIWRFNLRPDEESGSTQRVARLTRVDMYRLFQQMRGDLYELAQYAKMVRWEITTDKRPLPPLPRRPTLQSPRLFQQGTSQSPHRSKGKAARLRRVS